MIFIRSTFKAIPIYLLLTVFSFCNGQSKISENITDKKSIAGKTVSEIDKRIWAIFQDKKNAYWFGSNGNGVYWYDGKKIKQFTKQDGLCSNLIRGIQEDKSGNIYFDTSDGVSKFDGKKFISLTLSNQMLTNGNCSLRICGSNRMET